MTPRVISFVDLKCIPGAIGIMERNDKKEVETLLEQLGYDIKLGYEINVCHHRVMTTNQPVYGPRVEGYESCSDDWLDSGFASMEARMEAVTDPHLRQALLEMCKTGSSDKTWTNEDTAKAVVRSESKNYQKKN